MKLFDFLKKNSNRKTLTPRPSKTYCGELYYSYKQCYEDDFESYKQYLDDYMSRNNTSKGFRLI